MRVPLNRIDNITTVAYLRNSGGYYPHLNSIARHILLRLLHLGVASTFQHLRGVLNVVADALSRGRYVPTLSLQHGQPDHDDWSLSPRAFAYIDAAWGPHTVDRFARARSRLLPRFWSRTLEPGCEGVNSLTADWAQDNNFVNAPFNMLLQVLAHIMTCRARATVVLPYWPAQPWWTILKRIAVAWCPLSPSDILPSQGSVLPEPLRNPAWRLLAVRVDASRS